MKHHGSRFCRRCGTLFPVTDPDAWTCGCKPPDASPAPVAAPAAAPPPPRRDTRQHRPARPRPATAGRNAGPVSGPRTLPMLRALADAPDGLTTPVLAEFASSATSWVNALGTTRLLLLKQVRLGRVTQAGTVTGDRTRGSVLWRITDDGLRYVRHANR